MQYDILYDGKLVGITDGTDYRDAMSKAHQYITSQAGRDIIPAEPDPNKVRISNESESRRRNGQPSYW